MSELRLKMHELCVWVREHARGRRTDLVDGDLDVHRVICRQAAQHFKLLKENGEAPKWLDHVVAGVIQDMQEGKDKGL